MADNSNDKAPAYSSNDTWADAVKLLTGYNLPPRGEIFKDKLYGNDDIPLMKLQIDDWDVEPDLAEISAINAMSWRTKNSGWRPEGWDTDFVVPFYSGPSGVGSTVHMKKARITLLGTDADHNVPAGGVDAGATFGAGSRLMPDGFKGWDSTFLGSYSYGGGRALEELLKAPLYSTYGFSWNNIHVDNLQAVDLTGFERAAKAFDRAARFFHLSRNTIQSWQDEVGNTEDAAWRGQAAGVFWDIIRQLGNIYQNYEDALPLQGVFSAAGNDLRQARQGIYNAVSALHGTWSTWALYEGNPLRWLHDILLEVTDDIWDNNLVKVRAKPETHGSYGGGTTTTWSNVVSKDGFRTTVNRKNGGSPYGDLNSMTTWKAIGDEAISRWQQSVVDQLGGAGTKALDAVNNAWVGLTKTLANKMSTQSISLQADYQQDKELAAEEERKKKEEEQEKKQAEAEAKAQQQYEEQQRHEKELEEKADRQRQEDLQHQKEQEEKADRERQEAEQHQKEQEEKAQQQQEEQERKQEEQQKKQEEQQQKQEAEAKQQYEQQRQDQQAQEKKQEELQQKQEAEAKQQAEQQMAQQLAMQQQQEKKQEEQEKKQEELQQKQEKKQEQLQQEQEKKQEEQEKKQEEAQKKQEELAQQQYQQQQKTQSEYQQKQEDQAKQQYEQQRKDQQEQEKKQEELQQQQEAKAEQQQKQLEQQYGGGLPGGGSDQQQQLQQQLQQQQDHFQNQLEGLAHNQVGSQSHINPDGTVTTDYSDGSSTNFNPHTGVETTTLPDGHVSTDHLSAGQSFTNPDGSSTTVNNDGTLTTHFPDGSTTTINPQTGMATTHEPDGRTITTNLQNGASLPHIPSPGNGAGSYYEPELHDLPYNGSLGSANLPAGAQAPPGSSISESGSYLPLGTRIDGTTSGGMPPAGTPMTGGAPMGGGMPMGMGGGMGGMGGGSERNGSGERVRQVYDDDDIVTSEGGALGRGRRRTNAYETETAAGRRTPTAAGYDPYGGDAERERTESGERERETWVPEEEDVWGTDEGGSPAVIG